MALPTPNFAGEWRTRKNAEARGLAPGPRQPGEQSPRRARDAQAAPAPELVRPRTRSFVRPFRARRRRSPLPALSPRRPRRRRSLLGRVTPPAETRAVSWTAAPALPISAARWGSPEPRAVPDA